jgi:hypothetical protein
LKESIVRNQSGFWLHASHTKPVAAGTVVRLSVRDGQKSSEDLEKEYDLQWTIVGPFTGDERTFPARGRHDFDTSGLRSGAYTISVRRTRKAEQKTPGTPRPAAEEQVETERRMSLFTVEESGGPGDVTDDGADTNDAAVGDTSEIRGGDSSTTPAFTLLVEGASSVNPEGVVPVSLQRTGLEGTPDQVLWVMLRNRTNAIGFRAYKRFIDGVMCRGVDVRNPGTGAALTFTGTQAYEVLKQATNAFLMQECGIIDPATMTDPRCIGEPQAFLDVEQTLESLEEQLSGTAGGRLAGEEARRLGRKGLITIEDLRTLRARYFEDLATEQAVVLPYLQIIRDRLSDIPLKPPTELVDNCYGILRSKLTGPLALELIWSYWHEEGMLVQSLNAILARFQNRRLVDGLDPLARLDLDPLRPLSNLFWGWAEDEVHRLTVRRRAFEYDHEYGVTLLGKAVPTRRTVDSRSNFLESFHTLLNLAHVFFKEDDDTTVIADGFPLLNALRETHLLLAEGAHNQFGDLPSTSRAEMLIMEWLLARPEMREFLGGRVMVPYEEEWEDRVDTMKTLQGWTDVSITHFRDLGVFGEQILLSIRYGNWSVINDPQQAANWARYWRPEIQRYAHAYRAATGADLTQRVDATMPAHLLRRRLAATRRDP